MVEAAVDESIANRAHVEEAFHDAWAKSMRLEDLLVHESFDSQTAVENRFALEVLGGAQGVQGKRLLDLGCGAGESAVFFALQGAEVTAADVSGEMLRVARSLAAYHGVEIRTSQILAEAMPFQDGEFDWIYGNGVLHHVELEPALREISRVLASGGLAVFIEPLSHNPVIKVYRRIAREVRTPTEQPFTFKQFRVVRRHFPSFEHREFWFSTLGIFLYYYFIERVDPGTDRYWKRIIKDGWRVERAFRLLHRLDGVILRFIPCLRRWCWNTVIVVEKP
jgi:ubiquinone/menaquinone biosynthesis C-methylase UbiE